MPRSRSKQRGGLFPLAALAIPAAIGLAKTIGVVGTGVGAGFGIKHAVKAGKKKKQRGGLAKLTWSWNPFKKGRRSKRLQKGGIGLLHHTNTLDKITKSRNKLANFLTKNEKYLQRFKAGKYNKYF